MDETIHRLSSLDAIDRARRYGLTRRRLLAGGAAAAALASGRFGPAVLGQSLPTTRRDEGFPPSGRGGGPRSVASQVDWRSKVLARENLARVIAQAERIDPNHPLPPGEPGKDYTPVITPDNVTLPFDVKDGVKIFHIIAEEVLHEFLEGLRAYCWGYNGHVHGPTVEVVEGDRIRIYVTNRLPAPTTVHWHGFLLSTGMDGVSGLEQPAILPGQTFVYEFTVRQHGTFMYHSHHDTMTQEGMGMTGLFIVHPRRSLRDDRELEEEVGPPVDRDYAMLLHEWRIDPGAYRPNPFEMTDFNVLTMNARAFPGTTPLVAEIGERVRIRFGNLSAMDHHPIHLHGYEFAITAEDGWHVPPDQQRIGVTELVPVGNTRDFELIALYPGDWIFHCHMSHHIMNQMGHEFPNTIGMRPGELDQQVKQVLPGYMTMGTAGMNDMTDMGMPIPENSVPMKTGEGPYGPITFGGMASILKIRDKLPNVPYGQDIGWYTMPRGTQVHLATESELKRDGIRLASPPRMAPPDSGDGHEVHH